MTPKEKAVELVSKFEESLFGYNVLFDEDYVKCMNFALIAVDEIIRTLNCDLQESDLRGLGLINLILYWQEVKQEIEKL
jgi:hypothetical protein